MKKIFNMDLKGKISLVTGASRGIGRSISLALAECGSEVFLTARDTDKLIEVKKEIERFGAKAHVLSADLSKKQDITCLFEQLASHATRLDILINNAAIGIFKNIEDLSCEDFEKVFNINVKSMFLICKEALKFMIKAKSGYIINISSVQGVKAYKQQSVYAASKHAVMGLTKAIAVEKQSDNIRVSAILPGGVDTDFIAQARPDLDRSILIRPEDIANTVLYLLCLSPQAMVDEISIRRSGAAPF